MIKSLITLGALAISNAAFAFTFTLPTTSLLQVSGLLNPAAVHTAVLEFNIGESADYNLDMGGFMQGTMTMLVREESAEGYWIEQDVDLGGQQQKIEINLDKNSGQIVELLVNGQKQTPPDASNQELVESKEDHITVPAGDFDCVYLRIKDNSTNEESEAWLNPEIIPVMGMLKNVAPSQFGQVVIELTGYQGK